MKKLLVIITGIILSISACKNTNKEENSLADSLANVNQGLKMVVSAKDSSIESFITAFNEIQESLNEVKSKQKMISNSTNDPELKKNMKEQIVDDIQSINELMQKNKSRIETLKEKLKSSSGKVDELEKMITFLSTQVQEKDLEIVDLKNKLERLNIEVTELTAKYEEKAEESNNKTAILNTAYYAIGTSKELKEKNVITKEGGFIGIGKSKKVSDDFDKSYFTKIDILQNKSFTVNAKKAKLITTHPSSSYTLDGDKKVQKLVVLKPQEFWSASKFMVLVIEN